jgi:hypothetical protein
MPAEVGNDCADAGKVFDEWTPVVPIERRWMEKDYRQA